MYAEIEAGSDRLLEKSRLTVAEMAQLIAERVAKLPSVAAVKVGEDGEVAVDLVAGQRIEVQALPVAHAFNDSLASRRQALDELALRCA